MTIASLKMQQKLDYLLFSRCFSQLFKQSKTAHNFCV